ncbi:hypothetical protein LPJ70_007347, partial [Coemansia sp. RSA 2708]
FGGISSRIAAFADWAFSFNWSSESKRQDERANPYRSRLWLDVTGKVLELGPGFSSSLKLLPHKTTSAGQYLTNSEVIQSYTALEPNPFMYGGLQKNAEANGFRVKFDRNTIADDTVHDTAVTSDGLIPFDIVRGTLDDPGQIPQLVLDNAPYDTVITSFSLCTAKDPEASLKNIVRLLKPGGAYIFIEHIRHPPPNDPLLVDGHDIDGVFWSRMQSLFNPLWNILGHGCHIIRETGKTIEQTPGWESVDYRYARIGGDILSYFVPMAF